MKLWEYFLCEENKNNDFVQQFLLFHVSLRHTFIRVLWCMRVVLLTQEPAFWTRMHCTWFQAENDFDREDYKQKMILTERITSRKWFWQRGWLCKFCTKSILVASQNDRWTTDVTWTILTMSLLPFWALNLSVVLLVYGGSDSSRISSKYFVLSSEDEGRYYGFGTTWGWVIIDRIWFFGWTIPKGYSWRYRCIAMKIWIRVLKNHLGSPKNL